MSTPEFFDFQFNLPYIFTKMKCLSDISLFNLLFLLGDTPVDGLQRPKLVELLSRSPWNTLSHFLMTLNYLGKVIIIHVRCVAQYHVS